MNLKDFSTPDLEKLLAQCKEKICKMIADLDTIMLCSEIEKELQTRK